MLHRKLLIQEICKKKKNFINFIIYVWGDIKLILRYLHCLTMAAWKDWNGMKQKDDVIKHDGSCHSLSNFSIKTSLIVKHLTDSEQWQRSCVKYFGKEKRLKEQMLNLIIFCSYAKICCTIMVWLIFKYSVSSVIWKSTRWWDSNEFAWLLIKTKLKFYNMPAQLLKTLYSSIISILQVINLINVWWVWEHKRDNGQWTAISMCPLHLSPGKSPVQGQRSSPTICGIAGGNEAGWVNIYVGLIDKGTVTGVVCVWFPSCMDEQRNESIHNCPRCYCQGVLRISHDLRSSDRQTERLTAPHGSKTDTLLCL